MPVMADGKTYRCEGCDGLFPFVTAEEHANEEYAREFPAEAKSGAPKSIVCDECFQSIQAWRKKAR